VEEMGGSGGIYADSRSKTKNRRKQSRGRNKTVHEEIEPDIGFEKEGTESQENNEGDPFAGIEKRMKSGL